MKTYLDCIPCFFKQALEAARMSGADERMQKRTLIELAKILPGFPLTSSPPEMGRIIYSLVNKIIQKDDPYLNIKEKSNRLAQNIYGKLKKKISRSNDRLLMAVELAIAGNIIDYGAKNTLNVDVELTRILNEENKAIKKGNKSNFNYVKLKQVLNEARNILYLADNAGEVVFDRLLIEEIKRLDSSKRIIYAVKEKPIINDALIDDALFCGMDKIAEVISCGADIVISKGQGNFESLSQANRPIFFLFIAKCQVIAKDAGCMVGDIILIYHSGRNKKRIC